MSPATLYFVLNNTLPTLDVPKKSDVNPLNPAGNASTGASSAMFNIIYFERNSYSPSEVPIFLAM